MQPPLQPQGVQPMMQMNVPPQGPRQTMEVPGMQGSGTQGGTQQAQSDYTEGLLVFVVRLWPGLSLGLRLLYLRPLQSAIRRRTHCPMSGGARPSAVGRPP